MPTSQLLYCIPITIRIQIMTLDQKQAMLTLLRMISGAKYSGVPHRVHVLPLTLLAKPKSVT